MAMQCSEADRRLESLAAWISRAGVAAGLTGYETADAVLSQAIAPAAVIADSVGDGALRIAEIGAGSGALGLALAILLPSATVCLLDASGRSAVFVEMSIRRLRIHNATTHRVRLPLREPQGLGGPFDRVVVRALAPGEVAVPTAASLCKPGGRVLWLHSDGDPAASCAQGGAMPVARHPSGVEGMMITEFAVDCAALKGQS
jgi:16S rRNA G527 N7-methylase RsmG